MIQYWILGLAITFPCMNDRIQDRLATEWPS